MSTLDDILNEKNEKSVNSVENTEKVETKEVLETKESEKSTETKEQVEARARDEKGKFVQKEKEAKEAEKKELSPEKQEVKQEVKKETKQEMSERERAFLAAAHDERLKRQALEKRLQEIQQGQQGEPKTFWDDPEGSLKKFQEEVQGVVQNTRLNTAEAIARSKYKDFDDQVQVFAGLLQQVPGLYQQWLSSPDPAEFAYTTGKKHREISQLGNLDSWKSEKEKEIRLTLQKEFEEKQAAFERDKAAIPGSLSDARGAVQHAPQFSGPTPLESILKS